MEYVYTPAVRYFRSGRSGLALGVFILPPTSSFIRYTQYKIHMLYLLDSQYIYMHIFALTLIYQYSPINIP